MVDFIIIRGTILIASIFVSVRAIFMTNVIIIINQNIRKYENTVKSR